MFRIIPSNITAKRIFIFALLPIILFTCSAAAPKILPTAPDALLFSETIMVPLSPLLELLSLSVISTDNSFEISNGRKKIIIVIDETAALANGKNITLQMAPFTRTGVCYIPLEACINALGGSCDMVAITSSVNIKIPGQKSIMLPTRLVGDESKTFRDDHAALFSISLDGKKVQRLSFNNTDDHAPTFSPDGKIMLYQRNDDIFIRAVNSSAGNYLFQTNANSQRSYQICTFTPKEILYVQHNRIDDDSDANRYIGLISHSGKNRRLLANGHSPMMTPNGKYIIYSYRNSNSTTLLRIMTAQGTDDRLLIDGDNALMHPAQQLLFFQRRYCDMANSHGGEMPVYQLLTSYATDKNQFPQCLLEPLDGEITGDETEAFFKNDGNYLAFRKAGQGLFMIDFAKNNRRQLTTNPEDCSPRFSNNNLLIFLRRQVLMSVNIDNGVEQVIYTDRPVLSFNITPDGNSIIFSALPEDKNYNLFLG